MSSPLGLMAAGPLRGAGGGAEQHLGCGVFVSVSERSWAEAAERISRGQVRTANKLQLLCLKTALASLCQSVILKRSRRGAFFW